MSNSSVTTRDYGGNPKVQKKLASAARAIRRAIADVSKGYDAAEENSDDELRCTEAISELEGALEHVEWQPPAEELSSSAIPTSQTKSPAAADNKSPTDIGAPEAPASDCLEWAAQQRSLLRPIMRALLASIENTVQAGSGLELSDPDLRELYRVHPQYRWCNSELERVQQMLNETWARFEPLVDSLRAEDRRPCRHLRLVVNNGDRRLH